MTRPEDAASGPLRRVALWRVVEALREHGGQIHETGREPPPSRQPPADIAVAQRSRGLGKGKPEYERQHPER